MTPTDFFASLWDHYTAVTPQAQRIQALFKSHGENVLNDHVAFRTFNNSPISLEKLEPQLEAIGYKSLWGVSFRKQTPKSPLLPAPNGCGFAQDFFI